MPKKKKQKKSLKEFSGLIRLLKGNRLLLLFGIILIFIGSFASIFNGYF